MAASWLKVLGGVSLAVAATAFAGCGAEGPANADDPSTEATQLSSDGDSSSSLENASLDEDYGTAQEALINCSNPDGTNAVMAAFAVAVAQELGRWNASKDFIQNNTTGKSESSYGPQQAIKLASGSDANGPIGKSRCSDGRCARVQALLDLQYDQANNQVYVQGSGSTKVLLNPAALRSRMYAKWQEQKACDQNARDGDNNSCTKEMNSLQFVSAAKGGCDTNFTFSVKSKTGTALRYPNQLKNEVKFADATNPYINFQNLGNGKISIDPTYGLDDDGTNTTGSCTAACTKISTTNYAGACCSCGGVSKKFTKSAWSATTFLCK